MADRQLAMALAKVIIAAAWVDGHLASDEINSLKLLLTRLGQTGGRPEMELTANDWAELEIYLHSPVDAAERARLVDTLAQTLRGSRDRQLALEAIDHLFAADGVHTDAERTVAAEISAALAAADVGILARIGRMIRSFGNPPAGPNREHYLDEFLNNRIYFAVRQRLGKSPADALGISAEEAYTLALAGGLLARVARVDQQVTDAEFTQIVAALEQGWGIDHERAVLVAEVALAESAAELDFYRLTKEFADSASVPQRERFLDALFAVAAADGTISNAESAEISRINANISLTHAQFVQARQRATGA
jgi:uncharacterized tellurite resistance protein B-like protein